MSHNGFVTDDPAISRDFHAPVLVEWAESHAAKLLEPLGARWTHTQGVALQAARVSGALFENDRAVLIVGAYLHDVGYAPQVAKSNFHPLDAADHLQS